MVGGLVVRQWLLLDHHYYGKVSYDTHLFAIREDHSFYLRVSIIAYHEDEDEDEEDDGWCLTGRRQLHDLRQRFFSFLSLLCSYPPNSRHPDRGIVKRVQVLRNERGCHGDIVAASCSLLLPLYAWCQQVHSKTPMLQPNWSH
ncbi:predicted protein [Lichtheimia corymbifera JMRC:FSU:9682]|uniref:Uncharacterized protein n=1 Tax=Lichtheimia corymbifera JMRC:FSU:9682 TaxID=1263082 RepID=A0A068RZH1_9FUNG|nr:predicted protein [Lichtheimia corymbifera JMRC:FSU:9682]